MELHAVKAWYDSHEGMVEVEDDVLSVVRQIREVYGDKVYVELDPKLGYYHFVERADGVERLIFSSTELTPKELERLMRADSHSRHYRDPYDAAELEQDALARQVEDRQREQIREMGEELLFNIRKAGKAPRMPMPVAIPRDIGANR